ncbi:hypothetical protein ACJX0J_037965, partial [Zea mays]
STRMKVAHRLIWHSSPFALLGIPIGRKLVIFLSAYNTMLPCPDAQTVGMFCVYLCLSTRTFTWLKHKNKLHNP